MGVPDGAALQDIGIDLERLVQRAEDEELWLLVYMLRPALAEVHDELAGQGTSLAAARLGTVPHSRRKLRRLPPPAAGTDLRAAE